MLGREGERERERGRRRNWSPKPLEKKRPETLVQLTNAAHRLSRSFVYRK